MRLMPQGKHNLPRVAVRLCEVQAGAVHKKHTLRAYTGSVTEILTAPLKAPPASKGGGRVFSRSLSDELSAGQAQHFTLNRPPDVLCTPMHLVVVCGCHVDLSVLCFAASDI
jgi:hypothetical protein